MLHKPTGMSSTPSHHNCTNKSSLLTGGQFSDFKITCRGHVFKVHRLLLFCKANGFLSKAVSNGFLESTTGTLDLPDDEPSIIARIIFHIYTGVYVKQLKLMQLLTEERFDDPYDDDDDESRQAMLHIQMFAAATRFNLADLQDEARRAFFDIFIGTQSKCINLHHDLLEIVTSLYESVPEEETALKDILLAGMCSAESICSDCRPSAGHANIFDVLRQVPDLMADYAMCQMIETSCNGCDHTGVWIVRPCECKKYAEICQKEACIRMYEAKAQCGACYQIGHMTLI